MLYQLSVKHYHRVKYFSWTCHFFSFISIKWLWSRHSTRSPLIDLRLSVSVFIIQLLFFLKQQIRKGLPQTTTPASLFYFDRYEKQLTEFGACFLIKETVVSPIYVDDAQVYTKISWCRADLFVPIKHA